MPTTTEEANDSVVKNPPPRVGALLDGSDSQSVSKSATVSVEGGSIDGGEPSQLSELSEVTPQSMTLSLGGIPDPSKSRPRKPNATPLRFVRVHGRPDIARVQLLLCNISDRPLHYKLKSNAGSNISSISGGSGNVRPHSSERVDLTWKRPSHYSNWKDLDAPKLLLVTNFLDINSELSNDVTLTRLIAHVTAKGSCPANQPPVEQLLLDALAKPNEDGTVSKQEDQNEISVSRVVGPDESVPKTNVQSLNDFINQLTPQQLSILLACIFIIFLALYNSMTRPSHH